MGECDARAGSESRRGVMQLRLTFYIYQRKVAYSSLLRVGQPYLHVAGDIEVSADAGASPEDPVAIRVMSMVDSKAM